jgi:integrating conjugative element protein (TIGR03759 family)
MMNKRIGLFLLILVSTSLFAANDVVNTTIVNSASQNTRDMASTVNQAPDWGLTDQQWAQYQHLMQGISGHYYANLTPVEVLGIQAKTLHDVNYFAELAAKQEHDKIEKELRFNAAFYAAAKRLYANEPLVKSFDLTPYTFLH